MRKQLPPDIQKQLEHRTLAAQAAIAGRKLAESGKRREALKYLREAEKHEAAYRAYGGKGPIT
jgi:hypothetical protein